MPSQVPTRLVVPCAAQSSDAIPNPNSLPAIKVVQSKKPARFALGDHCSSSEQDQTQRQEAHYQKTRVTRRAVDSDTGDYIDESAIDDDDDSSEWEASMEKSGKSSMDDMFFQRVDSKPNLTHASLVITDPRRPPVDIEYFPASHAQWPQPRSASSCAVTSHHSSRRFGD
ncbi:hypothetical protein FOWG_17021 [Fusarium oxysporum f. sp. lycopersici MN25]|nr:hypothetical protein FOWG_17021 [Fusarium oxysporum f. sp. lycopersici MN25]